jgi:hypothetical protein
MIQELPSTQNNPPLFMMIRPPKAGPAAKPKFTANRTKVNDLVRFSGFE